MHLHYHRGEASHDATLSSKLKIAALLTLAFVVFETGAGFYANGLSILRDAAQNFIDFLALVLVWWGQTLANKPPDRLRTFGYHRVKVLIALVNAAVLMPVLLQIVFQALERTIHPTAVNGTVLGAVGIVGLVCNIVIVLLLRDSSKQMHVRGAYLHNIADAVGSVLLLGAGIVISFTGWYWLDMAVALFICGFIVFTLIPIVRKSVHILLEGSPEGIDTDQVEKAIKGVSQIKEVHDLHSWDHGDGQPALTCHVNMKSTVPPQDDHRIVDEVRSMLKTRFGIAHTTIQVEHRSCQQLEQCTRSPDSPTD